MSKNRISIDSYRTISSPVGRLILTFKGETLTGLYTDDNLHHINPQEIQTRELEEDSSLGQDIIDQLREYFAGDRTEFDFSTPLNAEGTEFQKQVWNIVSDISFGHTLSYSQIADALDKAKASRAVGTALGKNPISILIPCHRVVGSDNSLSGYAGGLDMKVKLLDLEGISVTSSQLENSTKIQL